MNKIILFFLLLPLIGFCQFTDDFFSPVLALTGKDNDDLIDLFYEALDTFFDRLRGVPAD